MYSEFVLKCRYTFHKKTQYNIKRSLCQYKNNFAEKSIVQFL